MASGTSGTRCAVVLPDGGLHASRRARIEAEEAAWFNRGRG